MGDSEQIEAGVRGVLAEHGRLPVDVATISATADLYAAGLSSHASVTVMLGIEDVFDVELPQELVTKSTFASVAAITRALHALGAGTPGRT